MKEAEIDVCYYHFPKLEPENNKKYNIIQSVNFLLSCNCCNFLSAHADKKSSPEMSVFLRILYFVFYIYYYFKTKLTKDAGE